MDSYQIPDELKQRGRAADPLFSPDEPLYYLFDAIEQDRVAVQRIPFPDQSVNRAKYSRPKWVRLVAYPKYMNHGIAEILVGKVPTELASDNQVGFVFKTVHDPLEENYSHSEIRCYRDGRHISHDERSKIPKIVKLKYRLQIGQSSRVIMPPNGSDPV
jgi:hypothetical protein